MNKYLDGAFKVSGFDRFKFLHYLRNKFELSYRDTCILEYYLYRYKFADVTIKTTPPRAQTAIIAEPFQILVYNSDVAEVMGIDSACTIRTNKKLVDKGILLRKSTNGYTKKEHLFINVDLLNKEWAEYSSTIARNDEKTLPLPEPTPEEIVPSRASMEVSEPIPDSKDSQSSDIKALFDVEEDDDEEEEDIPLTIMPTPKPTKVPEKPVEVPEESSDVFEGNTVEESISKAERHIELLKQELAEEDMFQARVSIKREIRNTLDNINQAKKNNTLVSRAKPHVRYNKQFSGYRAKCPECGKYMDVTPEMQAEIDLGAKYVCSACWDKAQEKPVTPSKPKTSKFIK